MKWLCDGISLSSSVTSSVPPVCPRSYRLSPGPGWLPPTWSPAEPWRFGRAKLLFPSPPYVVPSSEKSAVFCESGRSWPLHHAHPFGAKLNGKILISATNGSAIGGLLGWAREDPEEGDDVVDPEVGLHVLVRLAATRRLEVAGEHSDFANVWLSHRASSLVRGGEDALECDAEAQHRERLLVRMGLGPAGHRDRVRCQVRVRRRRLVGQIRCREVVPGRRRVRVVVEDRDELVVRGKLRHDDR